MKWHFLQDSKAHNLLINNGNPLKFSGNIQTR